MPPVSQTNMDVGMVSSPGCSKTRRGFFRSPTTSQIALPKARAPSSQRLYASMSFQCGSIPQWVNFRRLMYPLAPSFWQYSPLSSPETTATAIPPPALLIWVALDPEPPPPPPTDAAPRAPPPRDPARRLRNLDGHRP